METLRLYKRNGVNVNVKIPNQDANRFTPTRNLILPD